MRGILIAVLVLAATSFAAAEDEWVRPYEPYLPGTEPLDEDGGKKVVAVRLVRRDEATIVPVTGGRVTCWTENLHGAELVAEAKTDEFGIANLTATRDGGEHWHFEGEGAAPAHDFRFFARFDESQVVLRRGRDVPIEVLGSFGKPLSGATVEVYLGCPHSPAVRTVATDEAGCAVLNDVDANLDFQLWVLAPGVRPGPYGLRGFTVGTGGRHRLIAEAATLLTGRVVDEEGKPLAGVRVREQEFGRGPRTVTDKHGRFTLHGLSGAPIGFYRPGDAFDGRPASMVREYDPKTTLVVRLRRDRPTAPAEGEPRHLVEILVRRQWPSKDEPMVLPEAGAPVRIVRESDGFTLRGRSGDDQVAIGEAQGLVRFSAPPGKYAVVAGGGWSECEPARAEVRVPTLDAEPVVVTLTRFRVRVGIDTVGLGEPELSAFHVLWLPARGDFPDFVPRTGPVAAVYEDHVPRVLMAGPEKNGERRFTWKAPEPTRVRIRIDAPGIEVFLCPLNHEGIPFEAGEGGVLEAETWSAGPAMVRVEAENWRDPWIRVDLPSDPGEVVDLGTVDLVPSGPREIRFTGPDGESGLPVHLEEEPESGYDSIWAGLTLFDDDAGETGRVLFDSDNRRWPVTVRVIREDDEAPGTYTTRPFVFGRGTPEVIPLPAGRIAGTVRGYKGAMPVVVYLDHDAFTFEDGKIDIRGVADGPHTLIVGARGHRGEVRRIVLKDGEERDLEIRLPRRISKR